MIRQACFSDAAILAALAAQLWKSHTAEDMMQEFTDLLTNPKCALFLAFDRQMPIGFAQCQLRHDYVEGTKSSPVGYLEGIYVSESHRNQGIARELLHSCENWAKEQGCKEFASDCELTNTHSLAFHLKVGFTETNRVICFTKTL